MTAPRQEAADDAVLTRIGQAVMLHQGGDREEARNRLVRLWQEIGADGDPYHRCTLAHYMADTQDDPAAALMWDLIALAAADAAAAAGGAGGGSREAVRGFYPALHLDLADDYLRLDRPEAARDQLSRARAAAGVLGADPYGDRMRAAITRLGARLDAAGGAGPRDAGRPGTGGPDGGADPYGDEHLPGGGG
ncbi:hypothetical protein IHE55_02455 [Streptomyces pactum]|uniref:Tetratricopeptide repeat protein n=1 Tax=Streptomyces pactum TaxID=68249 RepID=A0ABS0NEU6_9ACTN|nr:hypothetical protein [Streptomyces pactum]MBH5333725.1 hypothetical protein [Streptomyces pactum]